MNGARYGKHRLWGTRLSPTATAIDVSLVTGARASAAQPQKVRVEPPMRNQPVAIMSAQTPRLLRRQLIQNGRPRAPREPYRCFSCSIRQAQQQPPPPKSTRDAPGTTHFGFETIAEALKEQKG